MRIEYLHASKFGNGATVAAEFQRQVAATPSASVSDSTALRRWETIDTALLHELNRAEVESLLRKARAEGVRVLTPAERAFLDRMATQN